MRNEESLQPIGHGKCFCGKTDYLFQNPWVMVEELYGYIGCKACYTAYWNSQVGFSADFIGDPCQICGYWDQLTDGWEWEEDRSEERYIYSQILTEQEQEMYFGDRAVPVKVCRKCEANQGQRNYLTKVKNKINDTGYQWAEVTLSDFRDRNAMHSLGVMIARDVFEAAGYDVQRTGIEDQHPEYLDIHTPDPSESLSRLRSNPDLYVSEKGTSDLYRVEVKTTTMSPPDYRLGTNVIERLRSHHSDAVLLVYHIPSSRMFVKRIRDVNWDSVPVVTSNGTPYYVLQFAGTGEQNFENIEEFFPKVTKELIDDRKRIMSHLFRQYFVGLELHGRFTTESF
jgi:hypothetical protein